MLNECKDIKNGKKIERIEQTFAANIASLYYSSFAMKEGSIGKCSIICIESIISALQEVKEVRNNEKYDNTRTRQKIFVRQYRESMAIEGATDDYLQETKNIRKIISLIGEDIWRHKLVEMFDECDLLDKEDNYDILTETLSMLRANYDDAVIKKHFVELGMMDTDDTNH